MGTVHQPAKGSMIYLFDTVLEVSPLIEITLWSNYPPTFRLNYFSMTAAVLVLFVAIFAVSQPANQGEHNIVDCNVESYLNNHYKEIKYYYSLLSLMVFYFLQKIVHVKKARNKSPCEISSKVNSCRMLINTRYKQTSCR